MLTDDSFRIEWSSKRIYTGLPGYGGENVTPFVDGFAAALMSAGWNLIDTTPAVASLGSGFRLPSYTPPLVPVTPVPVDASPIVRIGAEAVGICIFDPSREAPRFCDNGHGYWAAEGPNDGEETLGDETGRNIAGAISEHTSFDCALRIVH